MDHMTLAQLLGNYGEFVGAIAVVATLLYLAVQIRHSGTQTEIQNEQSQYEQWNTALLLPASSPQVSDLCVRGRPSRSELSEGERLQFDTILTVAINAIEHAYRRSEDPESDPIARRATDIEGDDERNYRRDAGQGQDVWDVEHRHAAVYAPRKWS